MIAILSSTCLLASMLIPHSHFPWAMPGNFLQRLHISDVVVSGTIESLSPAGVQKVDGEELTATTARLRVDRVFQGEAEEELRFTYFTLHMEGPGGYAYSGPPPAEFRPHKRYLVFLKRDKFDWVVAMPLYALEVELALAPTPPTDSIRNFSRLLPEQRYEAIGEELEMAALLLPIPPPGVTGEAAAYFPPVYDLLGGCAEPFYRKFLSSPSPELRAEALRWSELISLRHRTCKTAVAPVK
jgi:hypothetical protein